jgi:hypothetical protein
MIVTGKEGDRLRKAQQPFAYLLDIEIPLFTLNLFPVIEVVYLIALAGYGFLKSFSPLTSPNCIHQAIVGK